ncbi:MAG: hypothetical protein ACP5DC_07260 [Halothiobacillaceae bacterium]
MDIEKLIVIMSIATIVGIFIFLGYVFWMFWKKSGESLEHKS